MSIRPCFAFSTGTPANKLRGSMLEEALDYIRAAVEAKNCRFGLLTPDGGDLRDQQSMTVFNHQPSR